MLEEIGNPWLGGCVAQGFGFFVLGQKYGNVRGFTVVLVEGRGRYLWLMWLIRKNPGQSEWKIS